MSPPLFACRMTQWIARWCHCRRSCSAPYDIFEYLEIDFKFEFDLVFEWDAKFALTPTIYYSCCFLIENMSCFNCRSCYCFHYSGYFSQAFLQRDLSLGHLFVLNDQPGEDCFRLYYIPHQHFQLTLRRDQAIHFLSLLFQPSASQNLPGHCLC